MRQAMRELIAHEMAREVKPGTYERARSFCVIEDDDGIYEMIISPESSLVNPMVFQISLRDVGAIRPCLWPAHQSLMRAM